jgi:hypothetical protein
VKQPTGKLPSSVSNSVAILERCWGKTFEETLEQAKPYEKQRCVFLLRFTISSRPNNAGMPLEKKRNNKTELIE